jgi:hypothetical protein
MRLGLGRFFDPAGQADSAPCHAHCHRGLGFIGSVRERQPAREAPAVEEDRRVRPVFSGHALRRERSWPRRAHSGRDVRLARRSTPRRGGTCGRPGRPIGVATRNGSRARKTLRESVSSCSESSSGWPASSIRNASLAGCPRVPSGTAHSVADRHYLSISASISWPSSASHSTCTCPAGAICAPRTARPRAPRRQRQRRGTARGPPVRPGVPATDSLRPSTPAGTSPCRGAHSARRDRQRCLCVNAW